MAVLSLLGEYEVSLDSKGRFRLPTGLLAQLSHPAGLEFVVNRGFEKCLTLFPKVVWDEVKKPVDALNLFDKKNRAFARYFYRGATELTPDSADRILIPKRLLEYAGAEKKLVLYCLRDRIEIWAEAEYERNFEEEEFDFSDLAQDVLGGSGSVTLSPATVVVASGAPAPVAGTPPHAPATAPTGNEG